MKIGPHIRPRLSLPAYSGMDSSELEDVVTTLRQDGYKILPFACAGLYSDEQIFEAYSRDKEIIASVPAGAIFVEETKGFHRGSAITRDFRLLMQLEFSVINIPTEQELAQPFPPIAVPGLNPRSRGNYPQVLFALEQQGQTGLGA